MALTSSEMMPLGTVVPEFNLPDAISKNLISTSDVKGENGSLVIFICNHCPYVHHMIKEFSALARVWKSKGIGVVAISSNDIKNYPEDSPDRMEEFARSLEFDFPYLFDESQEVAKAYGAVCTPDPFLFDRDNKCFYRGQLDASRPGNGISVSGLDMSRAIENLLSGEDSPDPQLPSIGCSIKWKAD
jgi:peroxiredoxin